MGAWDVLSVDGVLGVRGVTGTEPSLAQGQLPALRHGAQSPQSIKPTVCTSVRDPGHTCSVFQKHKSRGGTLQSRRQPVFSCCV